MAFRLCLGEAGETVFDPRAGVRALLAQGRQRFLIRFVGGGEVAVLELEVAQGEQGFHRDRRLTGAHRDFDAGAARLARRGELVALMVQHAEAPQTDGLRGPGTAPRGLGDSGHAAVHRLPNATIALVATGFQQQFCCAQDAVSSACGHVVSQVHEA